MYFLRISALIILISCAGIVAAKRIYQYTDENGIVHLSDKRPDTDQPVTSRAMKVDLASFDSIRAFAEKALDLGFDISFSGIVTFKTATDLQAAVAITPLDRLLVETDSPYLTPVPHRGRLNQPA